jgi:hypothetical protein
MAALPQAIVYKQTPPYAPRLFVNITPAQDGGSLNLTNNAPRLDGVTTNLT